MIFDRPLTAEERRASLRRIALFSLVNGVSYVCVGETIMVLAAVRLGCPDAVTAAIGTMLYVGFALLPLGRFLAARWGAAKSSAGAWVARNGFALLIAAALVWAPGMPLLASAMVLVGAFGFYGCRAAAVVLQGPLYGEAATAEGRSRALGLFNALFYVGMAAGLAGVLAAMTRAEETAALVGIVCVGSAFGTWSSWFLGRAHESNALRDGARKPVRADLREVAANRAFRRHVAACCCLNLALMLVQPASVIILKRGYGATDLQAMLYTMPFIVGSGVGSWLTGPMGRRWGPRKEMLGGFLALLGICAFWALLPDGSVAGAGLAMAALWCGGYFALGFARSVVETAIMHYYLSAMEPRLRISAGIVLYTAMGVLAGLVGVALTALLMGRVSAGGATDVPGPRALAAYRTFFLEVLVLLAPLVVLVWRVIPLPEEVRARIRHHHAPR